MAVADLIQELRYRVVGASREASGGSLGSGGDLYKAENVALPGTDKLWATGTNGKEWVVVELLSSPALLVEVRVQNKGALEWELSAALRRGALPQGIVKDRCEAPMEVESAYRFDAHPFRFFKLFIGRGAPTSIYSLRLFGILLPGLRSEMLPAVHYLRPHIMRRIDHAHNTSLLLLAQIAARLGPAVQHIQDELERVGGETAAGDTNNDADAHSAMKFLSELVGPMWPVLAVMLGESCVPARRSTAVADSASQIRSILTGTSLTASTAKLSLADRIPLKRVVDILRRAAREPRLRAVVCRIAEALFESETILMKGEAPAGGSDAEMGMEGGRERDGQTPRVRPSSELSAVEFEALRHDERNLDGAEALIRILLACDGDADLCRSLAAASGDDDDRDGNWLPLLPILRTLLPTLRGGTDSKNGQHVERGLRLVVSLVASPDHRRLLASLASHLCAGERRRETAACILVDACSGPLRALCPALALRADTAVEIVLRLQPWASVAASGERQGGGGEGGEGRATSPLGCRIHSQAALVLIGLFGSDCVEGETIFGALESTTLAPLLLLIGCLAPFLAPVLQRQHQQREEEKEEGGTLLALRFVNRVLHVASAPGGERVLSSIGERVLHGRLAPSQALHILSPDLTPLAGIDALAAAAVREARGRETLGVDEAPTNNRSGAGCFAACAEFNFEDVGVAAGAAVEEAARSDCSDADLDADYGNLTAAAARNENSRAYETLAEDIVGARSSLLKEEEIASADSADVKSAIGALLLAAECHVSPFIPASAHVPRVARPQPLNLQSARGDEQARDVAVLRLLIRAATWEAASTEQGDVGPIHDDKKQEAWWEDEEDENADFDERAEAKVGVSGNGWRQVGRDDRWQLDANADAVTIVRSHERLLYWFICRRLSDPEQALNEALLRALSLLGAATTTVGSRGPSMDSALVTALLAAMAKLSGMVETHATAAASADPSWRRQLVRMFRLLQEVLRRCITGGSGGHHDALWGTASAASEWLSVVAYVRTSKFPIVRFYGWLIAGLVAQRAVRWTPDAASTPLHGGIISPILGFRYWTLLFGVVEDDLMLLADRENPAADGKPEAPWFDASVLGVRPSVEIIPNMGREFRANAEFIIGRITHAVENCPKAHVADVLAWLSDVLRHRRDNGGASETKALPSSPMQRGRQVYTEHAVVLIESLLRTQCERFGAESGLAAEAPRLLQLMLDYVDNPCGTVSGIRRLVVALRPALEASAGGGSDDENDSDPQVLSRAFEALQFPALLASLGNGGDQHLLPLALAAEVLPGLSQDSALRVVRAATNWFVAVEEPSPERRCDEAVGGNIALKVDPVEWVKGWTVLLNQCRRCRGFSGPLKSADGECSSVRGAVVEALPVLLRRLEGIFEVSPGACQTLVGAAVTCVVGEGGTEPPAAVSNVLAGVVELQNCACWRVAGALLAELVSVDGGSLLGGALEATAEGTDPLVARLTKMLAVRSTRAPRLSWRVDAAERLHDIIAALTKRLKSAPLLRAETPLAQALFKFINRHPEPEVREKCLDIVLSAARNLRSGQRGEGNDAEEDDSAREGCVVALVTASWPALVRSAERDPSLPLQERSLEILAASIPLLLPDQVALLADALGAQLTQLVPPESGAYIPSHGTFDADSAAFAAGAGNGTFARRTGPEMLSMVSDRFKSRATLLLSALGTAVLFNSELITSMADATMAAVTQLTSYARRQSGHDDSLENPPPHIAIAEALVAMKRSVLATDDATAAEAALRAAVSVPEVEQDRLAEQEMAGNTRRFALLDVLMRVQQEERGSLHRAEHDAKQARRIAELREQVDVEWQALQQGQDPKAGDRADELLRLEAAVNEQRRGALIQDVEVQQQLSAVLARERAVAFHKLKAEEQRVLLALDRERAQAKTREAERQRELEREKERTRELRHKTLVAAEKDKQQQQQERQRQERSRDGGSREKEKEQSQEKSRGGGGRQQEKEDGRRRAPKKKNKQKAAPKPASADTKI